MISDAQIFAPDDDDASPLESFSVNNRPRKSSAQRHTNRWIGTCAHPNYIMIPASHVQPLYKAQCN